MGGCYLWGVLPVERDSGGLWRLIPDCCQQHTLAQCAARLSVCFDSSRCKSLHLSHSCGIKQIAQHRSSLKDFPP